MVVRRVRMVRMVRVVWMVWMVWVVWVVRVVAMEKQPASNRILIGGKEERICRLEHPIGGGLANGPHLVNRLLAWQVITPFYPVRRVRVPQWCVAWVWFHDPRVHRESAGCGQGGGREGGRRRRRRRRRLWRWRWELWRTRRRGRWERWRWGRWDRWSWWRAIWRRRGGAIGVNVSANDTGADIVEKDTRPRTRLSKRCQIRQLKHLPLERGARGVGMATY